MVDDEPVPGVDYDPAGCPICAGTDDPANHADCLDQLGVWPEPPYGEQ